MAPVPAAGRNPSLRSLLAVVVVLSVGPSLTAAADPVPNWTIIGAKPISKAAAAWTSMAVDNDNAPCVAYSDKVTNLTVRRLFGSDGWQNLGPPSIHAGVSTYLSLAQAPGGINHIAYRGNSGKVTVLQYDFNQNVWKELGAPRFSLGNAAFVNLAFDSQGTAYVIYSDEGVKSKASVQKFDGSKWVFVGARGFTAGGATDTRIAFGPNDVPFIAYSDATKGGRATVRKLSGATWALVGAAGFTANKVSSVVLRVNSLNRPTIGYIDHTPATPTKPKATASRWTGAAWTKLPAAGTVAFASQPRLSGLSLSLDSTGVPYIAFPDGAPGLNGKFTAKKYKGGAAWANVGKAGPVGGYARYLDIAVDNDDNPVVAFSDAAALNKTTVVGWKNPLMSVMALEDWGRGGSTPQKSTAALMASVAGRGLVPEFIISTGDNFYPNGLTSASDPQFAKSFTNVYNAPSLKGIQWECVLGNHDNCDGAVNCPNCKQSPEFQLSDNIAKLDPRFRAHRTSFLEDLGGGKIAIFFIDTSPFIKSYRTKSWSKCPGGIQTQNNAANLATLDSLLANSFAEWKIVIGHHPPQSNGGHGNNPDIIAAIEPLLKKHKVQAYFAGHDHNLEHLRKKVTPTYSYDTIVTGGGSSLSGGAKGTTNSLKFLPANGFVWASFFQDELLVDFYTVQGGGSAAPAYTARIPRKSF